MTATEERTVTVRTMSVTIDGHQVIVAEGTTIFDAAREVGVDIPVLCHNERYDPVGVCRMCVVDTGGRVFARGVRAPVRGRHGGQDRHPGAGSQPGHADRTAGVRPAAARRGPEGHHDPRQPAARAWPTASAWPGRPPSCRAAPAGAPTRRTPSSTSTTTPASCATAACGPATTSRATTSSAAPARATRPGSPSTSNDPMGASSCVTCGECVQACPTGALTNKPIRGIPIRPREELDAVDSVCPYCGVGCALTYYVDRERGAISFAEGRDQPGLAEQAVREGPLRLGLRGVAAAAHHAADPHRRGVPEGPALRGRPRRRPQRPRPGRTAASAAVADARAGRQARRQAQARRPGRLRRGHARTSGRPPGTRRSTWSRAGCGRSTRPAARARSPASARRSAPTRRPTSSRSSSAPASARTTSTTAPGCATPPRSPRCSRASAPGRCPPPTATWPTPTS